MAHDKCWGTSRNYFSVEKTRPLSILGADPGQAGAPSEFLDLIQISGLYSPLKHGDVSPSQSLMEWSLLEWSSLYSVLPVAISAISIPSRSKVAELDSC